MIPVDGPGWRVFPADAGSLAWAAAACVAAEAAIADPENAHWLRHGGTWFAGVNLLDTAPTGAVGKVPLAGPAIEALHAGGRMPRAWDRAQVSVIYPGYPRQDPGERDAAARYRRTRDAAHIDGLLPIGPDRRRMLREPHGFVLGLPLTEASEGASPLVVWEGSHRIMHQAFAPLLQPHPPERWPEIDLTAAYHAARRTCFDTCSRRVLTAPPGGAYLIHRLSLHGVAPWQPGAIADPAGRMIAYFRPEIALGQWIAEC
ncbi:MAG: hypothetical protein AAFO80_16585 [Pseudomonadota bacterium]